MEASRILCFLAAAALFAGCKSSALESSEGRVSERWRVRVDTLLERDTVVRSDSVLVENRGDTVYVTRTRWRERVSVRYRAGGDTVVVRDTVRSVKREVVKDGGAKLRDGLLWACGGGLAALGIAGAAVLGDKLKK